MYLRTNNREQTRRLNLRGTIFTKIHRTEERTQHSNNERGVNHLLNEKKGSLLRQPNSVIDSRIQYKASSSVNMMALGISGLKSRVYPGEYYCIKESEKKLVNPIHDFFNGQQISAEDTAKIENKSP